MASRFGGSNAENLSPDVVQRILKEVKDLTKEPIDDAEILVNERDITELICVLRGPIGTPYAGGFFRIKLIFPADFPHSPPKGYFLTKIFHPNVAPSTGEICVNTLKKDWQPQYGVRHVILTIRCLLVDPNPESALNEEAGKLLLENYDDYAKRARMFTEIHARLMHHVNDAYTRISPNNPASQEQPPTSKRPPPEENQGTASTLVDGAACKSSSSIRDKSKKMLKRL